MVGVRNAPCPLQFLLLVVATNADRGNAGRFSRRCHDPCGAMRVRFGPYQKALLLFWQLLPMDCQDRSGTPSFVGSKAKETRRRIAMLIFTIERRLT